MIFIIVMILLILLLIIVKGSNNKENIEIDNDKNIQDLSKYNSNKYIMTQTELKFYRELKKLTDKLELTIFPQIDLERLIKVSDKNTKDRNRIKSRSIDFTIVNNKNCKVICCIELDDNTHNLANVKKADNFKNDLFKQVNIPLYRIKVSEFYNLEQLEENIKNCINN